jgi:hypothetical protein
VLDGAATQAIDAIAGDARGIANHAVDGALDIPADMLLGAFDDAAERLLGTAFKRAKHVVKAAIKAIIKALAKLLRVLGPLEEPVRKWLQKKLGEFSKEKLIAFGVDAALGLDELRADVARRIAGGPEPADPDGAVASLESLAGRFAWHERIIGVLTKILRKVQGKLIQLAGWVAPALAGVYALVLGYGVWVAGDHLDWSRTEDEGLFDRVDGVRGIVAAALAPAG